MNSGPAFGEEVQSNGRTRSASRRQSIATATPIAVEASARVNAIAVPWPAAAVAAMRWSAANERPQLQSCVDRRE